MSEAQFLEVANILAKKLGCNQVQYVAKGAFKETYKAEGAENKKVALKIINPAKCNFCRNERELESMSRCDHNGIGRLLDNGEIKDQLGCNFYYTVEEFFDGGSLSDKLKDGLLSINQAVEYGNHLAEAIKYLAFLDLVHRDVKPENIMFRDNSHFPILIDFGLVRDLSKTSLTQSWAPSGPCTPYYAAPEQLNNDKALIDWRTDQFALGVVLCCCLTGKHPYQKEKETTDSAIIEAVASRQGCADWFRAFAKKNSIEFLIKMIHPWPNRRFINPSDMVNAFSTRR